MNKKIGVVVLSVLLLMLVAVASFGYVPPMFVATAKNLRGALYLGYGPTPKHASEQAIVKCSQDSVIPRTCKVTCIRSECPPPPPPCKVPPCKVPTKMIKKTKYHATSTMYRAVPYGPPRY
jgi:hypothetical protein